MPLSPRPPSGGGRPWSSTAIPPAYRRKRIANCERSIPLLTTRGYPLVLGDKIPMRPSSCVPGQHSTPVLAPARPASSASVPMKAAIKENSFKELVKYWEQTTLEKANTPSSLKPAVKGDRLGNDEDATMCNKTAADMDIADAYPEGDMPHKPGNLPLLNETVLPNKTAADVDTADAFPEANMPHKQGNLPLLDEAILLNTTAADVDTADAFPEGDMPHKQGNPPLIDQAILRKTTADVDTADAFPEGDMPHKQGNPPLIDQAILRKTTADVDTADAFPEGDMPHKQGNPPLIDQAILRKTTADVDTADAFPEGDMPHKQGNPPLLDEAILPNKTTADVDTAAFFPEGDMPHKQGNPPLLDEAILPNKTAADVDTADAFPEGDMPHKQGNPPLLDEAILPNTTAADVDTADAFPEADMPHKQGNLPLLDEAILPNKTAADVDTADAFPEGNMPHKQGNLPLIDQAILRNKSAADVDTADAFPQANMPHKQGNLPLLDEAILRKTTADVDTADAFPEVDMPHKQGNPPPFYEVITAADVDTAAFFPEGDMPHDISGIGLPLLENIAIDVRRARTLQQHLASVKQKVAASTTGDEWHRINELQNKMNIIDNMIKEISEKAKFVNKEMVDIESESFLIISKMETPRCMNRKEKGPPSDFQTLVKLPPIPTKAKPTAKIPTKNNLSGQTHKFSNSSSQIVKSSFLPRQMKTKPLPAIVPQKGKLNPVDSTAHVSIRRRPQTDIDNEYKQLQKAMDRVGRNLGPTPLQEHISYHEPEPGRLMRRPRNEQDNVPCRGKSKETKSETGYTEKPNQRKRNRNRQKKKKIEKAPMKIEDRPPFSADVKPTKYFSEISRLSDAS